MESQTVSLNRYTRTLKSLLSKIDGAKNADSVNEREWHLGLAGKLIYEELYLHKPSEEINHINDFIKEDYQFLPTNLLRAIAKIQTIGFDVSVYFSADGDTSCEIANEVENGGESHIIFRSTSNNQVEAIKLSIEKFIQYHNELQ